MDGDITDGDITRSTGTQQIDATLVLLAREGDTEAFAELFRRHGPVALHLARSLVSAADAEDIVSTAFAAVLVQVVKGRGPEVAVRAYVSTAVRRVAWRHNSRARRLVLTADIQAFTALAGGAVEDRDPFEHEDVRRVYSSLRGRWRHVLWQLEVEGRKPQEIAAELGLSANAVSALACRARAGLRMAYLEQGQSDAA